MLAISLHQPWASAIAVGAKRFETRGRRVHKRGDIAIHAALKWDRGLKETARRLVGEVASLPVSLASDPPLGAVVCVAELVDCHEMTKQLVRDCRAARDDPDWWSPEPGCLLFTPDEFALGDWRPGRFAYELRNVIPLREPYPLKGRQSLWTLHDDHAKAIRSLLCAA